MARRTSFTPAPPNHALFVTSGEGIVATKDEEVAIAKGDTAFIPADEKRGAADGADFSRISLTGAGSVTTQYDD